MAWQAGTPQLPSWRDAGAGVIGWGAAGQGGGDEPRQRGSSCEGGVLRRGTEKSVQGRGQGGLEEEREERRDKGRFRAQWGS